MLKHPANPRFTIRLAIVALLAVAPGCELLQHNHPGPAPLGPMTPPPKCEVAPIEKHMGSLPEYKIEPPDIVNITVLNVIPKAPYKMRVGDSLFLDVVGTLPEEPIQGLYPVGIGGGLNLGFQYGTVPNIAGKSVEEAQDTILEHLRLHLRAPQVTVSLGQLGTIQQLTGPRAVQMDGRINLGTYGTINIVGMTIPEAADAIENYLKKYLDDPEVAVEVTGFNSKFYYILTQGAGLGDRLIKVPSSGNETVLDAVAGLGGLNQVSSQKIWIARPGIRHGNDMILKVDWRAITQLADPSTNYQLLPGDRLYIAEDKFARFNNELGRVFGPFYQLGQFTNFMFSSIRGVNAGIKGDAPQAFQNVGAPSGVIVAP